MDEQGNFYKPLAVHLFDKLREQLTEIQEAMNDLPTPLKSEAMSILDVYEAQGKNKKTRQACINMIQLGLENTIICQALEVEEDYVEALRAELKA